MKTNIRSKLSSKGGRATAPKMREGQGLKRESFNHLIDKAKNDVGKKDNVMVGKVPKSLIDAQTRLYAGEENVSIQLINQAKREIMNKRIEKGKIVNDIDFMKMNNKAMAFSLLSDAQESINVGNSENAKIFIRQASQLLMGDFKRKGDKYHPEIEFSDGSVALF